MDLLRDSYKYTYVSTATTTDITNAGAATTCKLIRITVGETAAGAITVYDSLAGGTTRTVAVLKASIVEGTYEFGLTCSLGIQIVTAAASKITVVWSRV